MNKYLQCFVLFICVKYAVAVKFRCDYKYHAIGWFKYHEIPMAWPDAHLYCRIQGAQLASPITPKIMAIMKNATKNNMAMFTGIYTTLSKGQYYSVDGIPLSEISHKWMENEPNSKHNTENCLALNSDGEMADVKCNEPRPFMCYRKKSRKNTNICGTIDSEYRFYSCTKKCYKFHKKPRQFHKANFACSAEGGHLAIINSEIESLIMKDLFSKYPAEKLRGSFSRDAAFIGFLNWGENLDWTTLHGQPIEETGFDKFLDGQSEYKSDGVYCGSVFRNGLLLGVNCNNYHAFICEKEPNFPAVCDSIEQLF